jgi:hypothetical protein
MRPEKVDYVEPYVGNHTLVERKGYDGFLPGFRECRPARGIPLLSSVVEEPEEVARHSGLTFENF